MNTNINTSSTMTIGVIYYLSIKDSFRFVLYFFRSRELALRSWALFNTQFKFLSLLSSISKDSFMILLTSSNSSLSFSMFSFAYASLNSFLFLFICFSKSITSPPPTELDECILVIYGFQFAKKVDISRAICVL